MHDLVDNARCRLHIDDKLAVDSLESKLDFRSRCLDSFGSCWGIEWWGVHPVFEFWELVRLAGDGATETNSNPRKSKEY